VSLFGGKGRRDASEGTAAPGTESGLAASRPEPTGWSALVPPATPPRRPREGEVMANIGKSISIKGDLTGNEDLVIEGRVEGGKIELPGNELTIGANGFVTAEIHAKSVIVIGKVGSSVSATEKIEIQSSGSVDGDVRAPRLIVQEGATLNGAVEMGKGKEAEKTSAAPLLARTGTRLGD
jgi:cytoskeletal protein CcmA (bactofilin family)